MTEEEGKKAIKQLEQQMAMTDDAAEQDAIQEKIWDIHEKIYGIRPYDESKFAKEHFGAAFPREAGWWDENPLGGDTPLDYIYDLERAQNPQHAVELMQRWLAQGDTSAYAALGVWDHVLTTGPADYRAEFQKLTDQVKKTARLLQGDREFLEDWGETWDEYEQASEGGVVSDYLAAYAAGKAGQVSGEDRFWPAYLPRWELHDISTPYYSDEEIGVRLQIYDARNDDFVFADENVPGPRGADNLGVDSVDVWDAHQGTIDLSWEKGDDWPAAQIVIDVDTRSDELNYEIEPDYEY